MLTKDSVTVSVDAVVYYRVSNATVSVANVENAHHSTRLLAQTTLRNILGTKNLHEILCDRESISATMQVKRRRKRWRRHLRTFNLLTLDLCCCCYYYYINSQGRFWWGYLPTTHPQRRDGGGVRLLSFSQQLLRMLIWRLLAWTRILSSGTCCHDDYVLISPTSFFRPLSELKHSFKLVIKSTAILSFFPYCSLLFLFFPLLISRLL